MTVRNYFAERISTNTGSFCGHFLEIIKQYGNGIAMIDPETTDSLSYYQLMNRTKQMRDALLRLGIQHSDVIGTYAGNSPDYIIFVLAAMGLGAIVVPLNPACKTYEIQKYFNEAGTSWILTEINLFGRIREIRLENVRATIMLDSTKETFEYYSLQSFLGGKSPSKSQSMSRYRNKSVCGYDPAVIFFSSGTTGPPKGVVLNNQALIANVELLCKAQRANCGSYKMVHLNGEDVVHGVLPYFHAGGLLTVFGLLGLGVRIIVNRKFDGQQFLETLSRHKVTTALLVPPVLKFLAGTPNLCSDALHSLKQVFVGSAHVEKALIEIMKHRLPELNVIQLYGTTEAGAFVFMEPLDSETKAGSCGILLPGVECKNDGTHLDLEIGSHSRDPFVDGWLRTGDLGYYDSDQFVYITGRTKEMIKVRGWQLSPYEIEEAIQTMPEVQLCAVVGIPDKYSGQLPKAYIQLHDKAHLDECTIHQLVNNKFASYKHLKGGIEFVKSIPLTANGKVARAELLKMISSGSDRQNEV